MSADPYRIVVAEPFDDDALDRLRALGEIVSLTTPDESSLIASVQGADALLVRSYVQVTRQVIASASRLKVIGRGGAGLENIDLTAAREHGVTVVHTPAAATRAVAEFTVGLILALERRIAVGATMITGDAFHEARRTLVGRELAGLTLGIIGLGRIGKTLAGICRHGLGMNIIYNDIVEMGCLEFVAEPVSKETIYRRSDVISLHVPMTNQTRGLIGSSQLQQMKPTAALINAARGAIVDSAELAAALGRGDLAGAALDVHDPEPIPPGHPILSASNVLLTPHLAARTAAGLARMNDVVDDVVAVLQGHRPRYPA